MLKCGMKQNSSPPVFSSRMWSISPLPMATSRPAIASMFALNGTLISSTRTAPISIKRRMSWNAVSMGSKETASPAMSLLCQFCPSTCVRVSSAEKTLYWYIWKLCDAESK